MLTIISINIYVVFLARLVLNHTRSKSVVQSGLEYVECLKMHVSTSHHPHSPLLSISGEGGLFICIHAIYTYVITYCQHPFKSQWSKCICALWYLLTTLKCWALSIFGLAYVTVAESLPEYVWINASSVSWISLYPAWLAWLALVLPQCSWLHAGWH